MTLLDAPKKLSLPPRPAPTTSLLIVTSFDASGISRQEWDDFILDTESEIYSSYDWCRIWWRHYGRGRSLRLFVFREEGRLVGLVPMFIERVWVGLSRIKIAKPVGADFAMDVFGLPARTSHIDSVCGQTVTYLLAHEECDAIWSGFVPTEHQSLSALRRVASATNGSVAIAKDVSDSVLTVFDLPGNFEAYVATLAKAARQNFRRQLNLLKKASRVEQVVVRTPINPATEFDAFNRLHTAQWQAEGLPGHFNDWPGSAAFNLDLMTQFAKLGHLRMVHLHSDDRLVASQYAFAFGRKGYWRLAARATDKELGRYGLGVLGLMQLLQEMSGDGIRCVEGGYGRYPYKLQYGADERTVTSLLLKSTRPLSSFRTNLFVASSKLVSLLYYRIWRLRIAPKLPIRSAPLWRSWIRLRT